MKKLLTYLVLFMLLTSCEKQTDWTLQDGNNDFTVADGIITNELKVQSIRLSKPVNALNEQPQPLSAATVLISSNQLVYSFHEDALQAGTYVSDNAFAGIKNNTYSLLITTGSKVYSSKAVLAAPFDFVFLQYKKNTNDDLYRITLVASVFHPAKPAMYEVLLDWSKAQGYENRDPGSCKARLLYYTLPTLDVSEIFAPTVEKVAFPAGTLITERRYSLTDEHAAFIRALLIETTWQGGFFNTAQANIPTNLSTGAAGYFGACGVVEKKVTVN
ncbi:MAG: DUF4249 family protein [Bacteroidota bacterium]